MRKLIILLGVILFFGSFANASITNYQVYSPLPLGKNLIISGQLDTNQSGVWCSFSIYDDTNTLVKRLTDEKTNSNGFFASDYYVAKEPELYRGLTYSALTDCVGQKSSAFFSVTQREDITNGLNQEIGYWTSPGNMNTVYLFLSIIGAAIFVLGGIYFLYKRAKVL